MEAAASRTGASAARPCAPLITLVSASGGVGKSTIALLIGHLAARHSIKTAILEGDLQFGDMGFWLGLDLALSNLSQGASCNPVPISAQLDLFKAPVLPEAAEEISDSVAALVPQARMRYDLMIADTGQFWSGLTGELLVSSDLVLIVMDQRRASVYGALKALELCQRIGVPRARIACVLNRAAGLSKGEVRQIQNSLGSDELFRISDGKASIEAMVEAGRIEELVEGDAAPVCDLSQLLGALLPRIGLEYAPPAPQKTRRLFR